MCVWQGNKGQLCQLRVTNQNLQYFRKTLRLLGAWYTGLRLKCSFPVLYHSSAYWMCMSRRETRGWKGWKALSYQKSLKGEFHTKTHAPLIYPFCHSNLPGRHHFCQSYLYFHTGSTPWAVLPRGQAGRTIDSHYKLGAGQAVESSRYGNTDSFGKNDVYQVGWYDKRGELRVHVFWSGIPL